ncbi:hypothetical protein [Tessaracoccus sp. OH4464_COT-324]|uniref:hypothetical protein n=1 Tax=Tessaracoccus sp. OH4464_COT-324 TaxID=2491059 RepID=UPI000F631888|nr:hypothetical protein [Tessaracoccus sp. OH4464_COT-324]RRD46487.1 hypothetical protein EII42_06750 [Tessaracoccus sp. OH4464_COT-324]
MTGQNWVRETPPRTGAWFWRLLAVLVVVVTIVALWFNAPWRSGVEKAEDGHDPTALRPSGTPWNELPNRPHSPSPTSPAPAEPSSGGQSHSRRDCPQATLQQFSSPAGLLTAGKLRVDLPGDWSEAGRVSQVLGVSSTKTQKVSSRWANFAEAGVVAAERGFNQPQEAAENIIACHVTGGFFTGYADHEIIESEPVTIDGFSGHRVRAHAANERVPGGGAVYDAVVLDVGNLAGLEVFWSGAVDEDARAGEALVAARRSLRVG